MDIQSGQKKFIDKTSQAWEEVLLGIPFMPVKEWWGSPFAMPPFDKGGHIVVTTSRFVLCPRATPAAWPFHFAELRAVSTDIKLTRARLAWTDADDIEVRWDTLRKGAKVAQEAWRSWRDMGHILNEYPTVSVNSDSGAYACGHCSAPLERNDPPRKHCGACHSVIVWN
jgi:hypothetical protein